MHKTRVALTTRWDKHVFKCRCLNGEIRRTTKEDKDEDEATRASQLFSDLSLICLFYCRIHYSRAIALRYFNVTDTEKLWDKIR